MNYPRRHFLKVGAAGAALFAVGCDKLPRELRDIPFLSAKQDLPFQPSVRTEVDPIVHMLNRAAFGPRPGDFEKLQKLDRDPKTAALSFFESQLHPEKIDDEDAEYIVRRFETLNEPLGELFEYQETLLQNELMRATLARAVSSERQLYEVMVQFWSDHFNIDPSKGDCKWL
ncbi:MAG: hypothetical protein JWN25_1002, partial [Verrucomicrobiales bacterium]|nr:hypothetical protein [Verrucomicrobiales bacterium]